MDSSEANGRRRWRLPRRPRAGGPVKWSEAATLTLLDEYVPRYTRLKGTLRAADWTQVAQSVSERHFADNPVDRHVCRDRMDAIKKTYEKETARRKAGEETSWALYERVQSMYESGFPSRYASKAFKWRRQRERQGAAVVQGEGAAVSDDSNRPLSAESVPVPPTPAADPDHSLQVIMLSSQLSLSLAARSVSSNIDHAPPAITSS
ncbi:hypothetical protein L7F22_022940 [Adiantum nelumboides]|nr:hypothetical protein [Adiantum nelumboides]